MSKAQNPEGSQQIFRELKVIYCSWRAEYNLTKGERNTEVNEEQNEAPLRSSDFILRVKKEALKDLRQDSFHMYHNPH